MAESDMPSLDETILHQLWSKLACTNNSRNWLGPIVAELFWFKPVSTIIGASQFGTIIAETGFDQEWYSMAYPFLGNC